MDKHLYLFAGVNGAGKSTLYNAYIEDEGIKKSTRINTDEIVRTFGDWRNSTDQIKAGKIAIQLRKKCLQEKKSFNEETTLTGKTILKTIDKAKDLGYKIHLYYVGVSSPEIAKERIKNRVEKGGHDISSQIIEKRYYESIQNLESIVSKCDIIKIFDNTHIYKNIFSFMEGKITKNISKQPEWAKNTVRKILSEKIEKNKEIQNYNCMTGNLISIEAHPSGDSRWIAKKDVEKYEIPIKEGKRGKTIQIAHINEEKLYIRPITYYNVSDLQLTKELAQKFVTRKETGVQLKKTKQKGIDITD